MTRTPTLQMYASLQRAFDHFNQALFEGALPHCLITLRSSNRHRGYHHAERFISAEGKTVHELGLHPGFFTLMSAEVALSTLVHEMVHHWQECFGKPSRSNAHNREWVAKMESLGLVPTSTGLPGGTQTGRRVTHFIQPDGPYHQACRELLAEGFALPWFDRHVPADPETVNETREALAAEGLAIADSPPPLEQFPPLEPEGGGEAPPPIFTPPPRKPTPPRLRMTCPECEARAWTEPDNELICGLCKVTMISG
ncbi:MAG: SprT-like domain-containing protein [Halothiobacillaceae bacterium]